MQHATFTKPAQTRAQRLGIRTDVADQDHAKMARLERQKEATSENKRSYGSNRLTTLTKISAAEICKHRVRKGWIRLMREPWGHHSILLQTGAQTCLLAEADTLILAQSVYTRIRKAEA